MKNGKRPTKSQSITIQKAGLDSKEWLIIKNLPGEMLLVNRNGNQTKTITV